MRLSFDEIEDWQQFENLAVAYFESLKDDEKIIAVDVKSSGIGVDGGRDILVTFTLTDSVKEFQRIWVVQCKYHNKDVSPREVNDINIPTLLHSYKASGYLLICKKNITSKLSGLFENLEKECIFDHKYRSWSGSVFMSKFIDDQMILKQYFPNYYKTISE